MEGGGQPVLRCWKCGVWLLPFLCVFAVGGLGFEFVVGWRQPLQREWPFVVTI